MGVGITGAVLVEDSADGREPLREEPRLSAAEPSGEGPVLCWAVTI